MSTAHDLLFTNIIQHYKMEEKDFLMIVEIFNKKVLQKNMVNSENRTDDDIADNEENFDDNIADNEEDLEDDDVDDDISNNVEDL